MSRPLPATTHRYPAGVPEPWRTILTLVAGAITGVLSGMFGIGGAIVSNPAIRALGATPIESVGSTLPSIMPSALSGALRYHREGLLRTRVVAVVGLTGAVASVGGSLLTRVVPDARLLTLGVAALMVYTAVRTGLSGHEVVVRETAAEKAPVGSGPAAAIPPDRPPPPREPVWLLGCIGVVAGLFSGLLGIGGGLLMVPAFRSLVHLELKETLGTSLACVGIIAIPGTVTHALLGHVNWAFAVPLSIAVIPGARLGAHLAIGASERALRLSVAWVLAVVAVVYGTSEIVALL